MERRPYHRTLRNAERAAARRDASPHREMADGGGTPSLPTGGEARGAQVHTSGRATRRGKGRLHVEVRSCYP